jgi:tetratricopeptide (TPR) repeat protein
MKDTELMVPTEIRMLLEKAEEHLAKQEYAQAEKASSAMLAGKALESPQAALAHCILGGCCSATGQNDDALAHFQNAIDRARSASDLGLEARALNGLAIVQRRDQHTAIETAERARALAEQAKDKTQEAKALNILGSLHTDLADYPPALEYYKRALARSEEIGDVQSIAAYLGNIGNVYRILADYSRALDYFARALDLAERISNKVFIERNLHLIGEVYSMLADHERALDFFSRALILAEQSGYRANIGSLFISIGIVHSELADYARALDYYAKALTMAEEMGDSFSVATCLDNIGTVYWNLQDYPRALDYFSRALAVAEEMGARTLIANNLGNIGIVYKDSGDYLRALEHLERALYISEETGDRSQTGHWMHGIAGARRKLGQLDAAAQGFLATLHHRREVLQTNEGVAETLLELGEVLCDQGQMVEGLDRLKEAQKLAAQLGEKKSEAQSHRHIADACWKLGDAENAFDHFKKYHSLDKEVFSEASQKRIELFHIGEAVADKEREAELQRLRADRSEHDLANSTMQLLAQTELLSKFRDDLYQIVQRIPLRPDPSNTTWEPAIRELKGKLKDLPSKSIDWSKFESQFTNVHPDFKVKLLEKYPKLTKQELKMCLLARLGIKTSEMARLLSLSERTVDSHRLNLRKKVGLKKDQSLTKFLTELK